MARDKQLHAIVCYWKWVPGKRGDHRRQWELVEAYGVDDDGYPLVKPQNTPGKGDRQEWDHWMNKWVVPKGSEYDDGEWEPIMGRAVTLWSVTGGVRLMDFHPPKWVEWLSVGWLEEVRKLPNWAAFFESGYELYLGTERAVRKLLFPVSETGD